MQTLELEHANSWLQAMGSSFPTRDQTGGPLLWEHEVFTNGPPGKSFSLSDFSPVCLWVAMLIWVLQEASANRSI